MKVVNLNKARKARTKSRARQQADENSIRFGRTKGEKARDQAEVDRTTRALDGIKRED